MPRIQITTTGTNGNGQKETREIERIGATSVTGDSSTERTRVHSMLLADGSSVVSIHRDQQLIAEIVLGTERDHDRFYAEASLSSKVIVKGVRR